MHAAPPWAEVRPFLIMEILMKHNPVVPSVSVVPVSPKLATSAAITLAVGDALLGNLSYFGSLTPLQVAGAIALTLGVMGLKLIQSSETGKSS